VLASGLAAGHDYALRAKPQDPRCELQKVTFLGPGRSGKAKARHRDGDLDGLEEWVATRTLVCPWAERSRFLRDESRQAALREAADRDHDPVVEDAISTVFEATSEESGFTRIWATDPERARRLWHRAGLPGSPDDHPLAYTDRCGQLNLPYETALEFAQAFARAEPEPCIQYLQEWEDRLRAEGYEPGQRHSHSFLTKAFGRLARTPITRRAHDRDLIVTIDIRKPENSGQLGGIAMRHGYVEYQIANVAYLRVKRPARPQIL
jgi:hypothetical protein